MTKKSLSTSSSRKDEVRKKLKKSFWIFDSKEGDDSSKKPTETFLIIPRSLDENEISKDKENLLQVITYQCEIIYLLTKINKS